MTAEPSAPSLEAFERLAQTAFDQLPDHFRALCGNVVLHVADEATPEILAEMGIADPLSLSGLFEGVALTEQSLSDPHPFPNHVHLYRHAVLAEWREAGDLDLRRLIAHVLVHEIGHHFGFSDDEMHALEEEATHAEITP